MSVGPSGPVAMRATSGSSAVALASYTARSLAPAHAVVVDELRAKHPLPADESLVVHSRCEWRPEGSQQNAT